MYEKGAFEMIRALRESFQSNLRMLAGREEPTLKSDSCNHEHLAFKKGDGQ